MASRRGNGEGWISKDGLRYAYSEHGVRHYGRAKSRTDAQAKLRKAVRRIEDSRPTVDDRRTVAVYLKQWLEDISHALRPSTRAGYEIQVRAHIIPEIGHVRLSALHPEHIQAMYSKARREGVGEPTIRYMHIVLHRALKRAEHWRLIPRNPAALVDKPSAPKSGRGALTMEQVRGLMEAVQGDRLEALYVLAFCTGMRRGELMGLRWSDINLEAMRIHVAHKLEWIGGKPVLSSPKTQAGVRTLALPRVAANALMDHRLRQLEERDIAGERWVDANLIFCDARGGALHGDGGFRGSWYRLRKQAGLEGFVFHELRHSAGSILLEAGVPMKKIQALMGHARIGVTMDTYTHLTEEASEEAAIAMDRLLLPGG